MHETVFSRHLTLLSFFFSSKNLLDSGDRFKGLQKNVVTVGISPNIGQFLNCQLSIASLSIFVHFLELRGFNGFFFFFLPRFFGCFWSIQSIKSWLHWSKRSSTFTLKWSFCKPALKPGKVVFLHFYLCLAL